MTRAIVGDRRVSPTGLAWTVVRRWTGAGRFVTCYVKSDAGAFRYLPADEVDSWPTELLNRSQP